MEEVRLKIDGLNDIDLVEFNGLTRDDILYFLEMSLSEKWNICSWGIQRIEIKVCSLSKNVVANVSGLVACNMNGKVW